MSNLVSTNLLTVDSPTNAEEGVTVEFWRQLMTNSIPVSGELSSDFLAFL
ncbi:unnamed protein product [Trichobilharzia regenti]|nr:unnamed protein product [Trichobilharzia regenti]